MLKLSEFWNTTQPGKSNQNAEGLSSILKDLVVVKADIMSHEILMSKKMEDDIKTTVELWVNMRMIIKGTYIYLPFQQKKL